MSSSSSGAIFRRARFTGPAQPVTTGATGEATASARQSEEVLASARAESEVIRQSAYDEGFAEGRQAGYDDGVVAAAQEHDQRVADEVERLRELADAAVLDRIEMLQSVETQVVRLAIAVASRIIYREVALDESVVLSAVRTALKTTADASTARIRLHPLDRDFLATSHLPELERDGRRCELVADGSIERGGCVVESASGSVDARISAQLADVEAALIG